MRSLNVRRKRGQATSVIAGWWRYRMGVLVLIAIAASGTAVGATLNGKVLGSTGQPKPFVRIEIGPDGKTLFSGPHGEFQVELSQGHHTVQVYEHTKGANFTVNVPRNDSVITKNFRVSW